MGVVEDLKKTNKGQLQYTRRQKFTEEVAAPPQLYIYHEERPSSPQDVVPALCLLPLPQETGDNSKRGKKDGDTSDGVEKTIKKEPRGDDHKTPDVRSAAIKTRSPPVSPEYNRSSLEIRNYEIEWDNKTRSAIEAKESEFAENNLALQAMLKQRAVQLEIEQRQKMRQLAEQTAKLHLHEKAETNKRLQEMRDSHQTRKQLQDHKLKEGELKKQQLQEEERRRNENEKHQAMMRQSFALIKETNNKLTAAYDACKYKQLIPEPGTKAKQVITQIMLKSENMLKKAVASQEDVRSLSNLLEYARNTFDFLMTHIEDAKKKGMAEEEAEKAKQSQLVQEQEKAAAAAKIQAASDATVARKSSGGNDVSVIDEVVTVYEKYRAVLDETQKSLAQFIANPQRKKYRFELQKAVNMPINSISPVDGANLRDKLHKLTRLLAGHQIEGKHVTAKDAPEGITFCKNLIARMLVKKGEELVSSKHESAFAIAMVTAGLWFEHSDVGELILAHFHDFCPYIIPIYLPHDTNMSSQVYHRLLGYKVNDDGTIEPQDKFLKRMSGVMRLYAAILVSTPPRANCTHPHGIEHAWIWLSRLLKMDPQPDITATLTYDMLQVTGHALYNAYKVQFIKLLFMLFKDFLPRLKSVAVAGGPVPRLELFLQQTLKNFTMKQMRSPPEGYLSQNFWFT